MDLRTRADDWIFYNPTVPQTTESFIVNKRHGANSDYNMDACVYKGNLKMYVFLFSYLVSLFSDTACYPLQQK